MKTTTRMLVALLLLGVAHLQGRPDEPDARQLVAQGKRWYEKQEWAKAIKEYDEAIRIDPKSDDAFEGRATCLSQLGEWDKAIKDFDEAIRLNAKRPVAFNNRGVARYMKGDLDKALADYEEAIRLRPTYAPAFRNRGMIWKDCGEREKAIKDFSEAVRLNPKFEDAFVDRGDVWREKGDYEKALKDFDAAVALNPKSLRGLYNRAWLRATCPDEKFRDGIKAVQDAKTAYDQPGSKLPQHLAVLAAAHAEAGDFQGAVKWQQKALEDKQFLKDYGDVVREQLKLYEAKKPYRDTRLAEKPKPE